MTTPRRDRKRKGTPEWVRLGELLADRRAELSPDYEGHGGRAAFARDRDVNLKLIQDIELNARENFTPPTLRDVIAPAYSVTYESIRLALAGGTLEPAPETAARPAPVPEVPSDPSQPTPAVLAFARDCGVDPGNAADPYLRSVRQEIADATLDYGAAATGRQIFHGEPWSLDEATVWDDPEIILPDKDLLIACTRALRDRNEAARRNRSSGRAGLALATLSRR